MKILIEGMEFHAFHGLYAEENRIGAKYTVDMSLAVDDCAGANDDIESTVNYETVYKVVEREMRVSSRLIEHVARRIVDAVCREIAGVRHVRVTLYKYNPPLGGKICRVGCVVEK